MATDKQKLINLLREFGVCESESFHKGDCFVIDKSKGFYEGGYPYKNNTVLINSDGRLRRVEFLFNDDDSFKGLN